MGVARRRAFGALAICGLLAFALAGCASSDQFATVDHAAAETHVDNVGKLVVKYHSGSTANIDGPGPTYSFLFTRTANSLEHAYRDLTAAGFKHSPGALSSWYRAYGKFDVEATVENFAADVPFVNPTTNKRIRLPSQGVTDIEFDSSEPSQSWDSSPTLPPTRIIISVDDVPESVSDLVLETERLVLRRCLVSDAGLMRELWGQRDQRVPPHRRLSEDGHPTVEEIAERLRGGDADVSLGLLAAELRDSGEVIGYSGLIANDHGQDDEPELAYEFLRAVWGRGYATEASLAVVDWARGSGYRRLWSTIRDWNTGSRRVVEKLGFVESGRVDEDSVYGNSLYYVKDL
jgi:[ribosomal protein S5]-alanine N-acetyltransferase